MDVPLILLAAGRSTRFGALKQVAPVGPGGASILAYTAADALLAGFSRLLVVVRPEIEATVREHLDDHLGTRLPITYVHQTRPLGTAHAAMLALADADGPAAVANGDDFYGRGALAQLRRAAEPTIRGGARCALVAYPIAGTLSAHGGVSRGWVQTHDEEVTAIEEVLDVRDEGGLLVGHTVSGEPRTLPRDALGSMNLWMLGPGLRRLLEQQFARHEEGEFGLSTVLGRLADEGSLRIALAGVARGWFGLTFAPDLPAAQARMRALHEEGHYTASLAGMVEGFASPFAGPSRTPHPPDVSS